MKACASTKGEFLSHLECGRWFQGCGILAAPELQGTLGMGGLQVAALPVLVAFNLHAIICLSHSC